MLIASKQNVFFLLFGFSGFYLSRGFSVSPAHVIMAIAGLSGILLIFSHGQFNKRVFFLAPLLIYTLAISIFFRNVGDWLYEMIGCFVGVVLLLVDSRRLNYKKMLVLFSLVPVIDFIWLLNVFGLKIFSGWGDQYLMYEIKRSSIMYLDTNFTAILSLISLVLLHQIKLTGFYKIFFYLNLFVLFFLYSRVAIISFLFYIFFVNFSVKYWVLIGFLGLFSIVLISDDGSLGTKLDILETTSKYIEVVSYTTLLFGGGALNHMTAFEIVGSPLGGHILFVTILTNYGILGVLIYFGTLLYSMYNHGTAAYIVTLMVTSLSMLPVAFPAFFAGWVYLISYNRRERI